MSDATDRLEIEVSGGDTKKVEDGLNALAKSLGALQRATTQLGKALDGADFDQFGSGVRKLSKALQPLSGFKSQAGGVINSLKDFTETATNFNQFTRFDKFAEQIERLSDSLKPLADVKTQLGATLKHLSDVPKIMGELEDLNFDEFAIKVRGLADSLEPLGNIQSKLGSTVNQLSRFSQVTQQLDETFTSANFEDNIIRLVSALAPLMEIGKSNLGSTLNQLRKIPEIMDSLAKADMGVFADQMERVARAIKPLADEMQKVSQGFSAFPARIQRLIRDNDRLSNSNRALNRSYGVLGTGISRTTVRFGLLYAGMRRLASRMGDWLNKSNEYVENLHLFRLAMDSATESALEFAYTVQEKMGIDVSEWMRYQAAFQNMARGFGITEEKASIMSKTLTQLGYDLAAVFNVDYEVAMQKLQSAIAGQPRPMREWGFDISETTLKMVAMGLGIEKNVELMTQMEKAQLRFIQIMETSRVQGFLGDMARTIMTPANALRVLEQQILQLKRALGEALIPVLIEFIPYVIAGTKVITNLARAIAAMMGFELPEIDYTGLEAIRYRADDATDGLDNTTESLKKLKRQTMGFDELNILSPDTDLEGFNMGIDELGLNLSQYTYDFLGEMNTRIAELTEKAQDMLQPFIDNLPEIWELAKSIGTAFLVWKISNSVLTGLDIVISKLAIIRDNQVVKQGLGLSLTVMGGYLVFDSAFKILYGGASYSTISEAILGAGGVLAGSLFLVGGTAGWVLAPAIILSLTAVGAYFAQRAKMKDMVKEAFYGEGATSIMIQDIAVEVVDPDVSLINKFAKLDELMLYVENPSIQEATPNEIRDKLFTLINGTPIPNVVLDLTDTDLKIPEEELDSVVEDINAKFRTITLPDIATGYKAFLDIITDGMEEFNTAHEAFDDLTEKVKTTNEEIDNLGAAWARGLAATEEFIPKFNALLDTLNEDLKTRLDVAQENIMTALAGSFGDALAQAGVDLPAFVTTLSEAVNQGKTKVDETTAKLKELNQIILDGGTWTKEQAEEWTKLRQELGLTDPAMDQAKENFENLNLAIGSIDWGDPETVTAFFKQVNEDTASAVAGVNSFTNNLKAELQAVADSVEDEDLRATILNAITIADSDRDKKIEEIKTSMGTIFGAMQADMIAKGVAMSGSFIKEWESMNPFQKMFAGGEERFVKGAMRQYQDEIMAPILAEMNKSLEALGLEPVTLAEEAMDAILDALFTYPDETGATQFGLDLSTGVGEVLKQYGIDVKPLAEAAGWTVVDGIDEGMKVDIAKMKVEKFFETVGASLTTAFEGIKSSSEKAVATLFDIKDTIDTYLVAIGKVVAEWWRGVSASISQKASNIWDDLVTALKNNFSKVKEYFSGLRTNFTTWGKDLIDGLKEGIKAKLSDNWFTQTFEKIGGWFKKVYKIQSPSKMFKDYGKDLADGLKIGVDEGIKKKDYDNIFTRVGDSIKSVFGIKSPSKVFRGYGLDTMKGYRLGLGDGKKAVVAEVEDMSKQMKKKGLDLFEDFVDESNRTVQSSYFGMLDELESGFTTTLREIMSDWKGAPDWFKNSIFNVIDAGARDLTKAMETKFKEAVEGEGGIKAVFGALPAFFEETMTGKNGVLSSIKSATEGIAGAFGDIVTNLIGFEKLFGKEVSNPVLKFLGQLYDEILRIAAIAIAKWVLKLILNAVGIPLLADGGFVDQGQMFIARETGPELVGTIGGRTAVANNDQIVESVSRGVYQAVVAAMSGQQQDRGVTEVRVYLDGKDITRSVETEQRDRGLDLMPGGVLVGI